MRPQIVWKAFLKLDLIHLLHEIAQNNKANAATGKKDRFKYKKFSDAFHTEINNEHIQQPKKEKANCRTCLQTKECRKNLWQGF